MFNIRMIGIFYEYFPKNSRGKKKTRSRHVCFWESCHEPSISATCSRITFWEFPHRSPLLYHHWSSYAEGLTNESRRQASLQGFIRERNSARNIGTTHSILQCSSHDFERHLAATCGGQCASHL